MMYRKTPLQIILEAQRHQEELEARARQDREDRRDAKQLIRTVLDDVTPLTGRKKPFAFIDNPDTENASAPVCSLGVLTFDLMWVGRYLIPYYTDWAIAALVLHEVGHTIDCRQRHGEKSSWNVEHFADHKAGYLAGRLGYKLDGVREFYFAELDATSWTHPPARSRYAQFEKGFKLGKLESKFLEMLEG